MLPQFPIETRYWYLRDHQLFRHLDSAEVRQICLITNFKTAKKSEIIYFAHEEQNRVYLLKKGIIKIVELNANGDETVKEVLQKRDLFGQITLDETDLDEYAVALSDYVTVCSFRIEDFEKVIQQNPSLAVKFTKLVGLRFRRLENRYANLMFKDVRTRLLLFLEEWAQKEGVTTEEGIVLKNYLTHQDIAGLICSTRQTVSQLFSDLKQHGLLDYDRQRIIIPNLQQLKGLVA
ncbi:Crp/Fnr family transcriptional regulator [Runella sp.]|jgi:CRP/FNR family transcriptional regulator|uniref:Crp/Fnr family transcriptional regulator n=1 Tax=Runella sp. TaxID=1960881 RepID=UPI002624D194|nr:Crp/Fnr family transcriptional regulator [Runella sp.]